MLNQDQIIDELNQLSEEGNAKIKDGSLHTQWGPSANWLRVDQVEDVELAEQTIQDFYNQ